MSQARRPGTGTSSAPWITAAVLAAVAVILLVLLFVVVRPAADRHNRDTGAFSSAESTAMKAAATEMVNLLTFSRKSFAADYQRALSGTTGQLHSDLAKDQANTLKQLTTNKLDIKADVTDVALETNAGSKGMLVLLIANGYRVADSGIPSPAVPKRVQLTMVNVKGKWLATDLQGIDLV